MNVRRWKNIDEDCGWTDHGRTEGRTFVEATGMDEDEGWTLTSEEPGWWKDVDGRTDWQTSWRTNVCWGHGNGWGWRMNVEQWRTWMKKAYGWTDELKDERLSRPWAWMRMKDERGALKNMDNERRWTDGRTDERAEGRTFVEATLMDEDDSLLRRWMKNMDEDRLWG